MRIGEFTDTFVPIVDGVGRVVHNYALNLASLGQECYVIAPMNKTGYRGGWPFELVEYAGMNLPKLHQYRSGIPVWDSHYNARMRMLDLQIVHGHSPFGAGREALRQSVRLKVPLVATFHSQFYDDFYKATHSEELAKLGLKYVVEFFEQCDEVWTVSSHAARTLAEYGYRGEPVVIENGVNFHARDDEAAAGAAERYGLRPELPVMLYVGQMDWKKNILRTLEAAAELAREGHEFQLVLVGQGPDREAIAKKAQELNLESFTVFTGPITDDRVLFGIYQRADLFAFPSLYDTAGLVVREAAVMGTPSLVVAGSAPAECIDPGINGLVCQDTTQSMHEVLERYLFNRERLAQLGSKAQQTIPLFWKDAIKRALERYELLVERGRESGAKERDVAEVVRRFDLFKSRLED